MNIHRTFATAALLSLAVATFTACGGGGGDAASPPPPAANPPPSGGIDRSGAAIGAITGFGSIFVNGIEFDTGAASIFVDDAPGLESDLAVGQVVTVIGTISDDRSTGVARTVIFDDLIEGPVASIDAATGTLSVLGQTVRVDDATSFDDDIVPASLDGLAPGDVVEISGFAGADGSVFATRIDRKPAGNALEIHGRVSDLDNAAFTFRINALVVDWQSAQLEDFPSGMLTVGDLVEVHGVDFGLAGELIATRIEREDAGLDLEDGDEAEIEGLVTRFASASDFDVAGVSVTTHAQTAFENGGANDLGVNVKVEVEGAFDSNGVLVARKVSLRRTAEVRIEAAVTEVDPAAGTLTLLGIHVSVDALTRLDDASDARLPRFTLADLNAGDFVEIRGSEEPADSDQVLATLVRRDEPDEDSRLRGRVDEVNSPDLVILGVTVQTDASTEFREQGDQPISAADFFSAVASGTLVDAKGQQIAAGVLAAEQVEIEMEDSP